MLALWIFKSAIVDIGVIIAASNNPKVARDSIIPPPYLIWIPVYAGLDESAEIPR